MDPQLKKQLRQTIYKAALSSVNSYGDQTYGSASAVSARVEPDRKVVTNAAGEEVVSDYLIITETAIALTDRVWLPGDSQSDATLGRAPKAVYQGIDELGSTSHYETRL